MPAEPPLRPRGRKRANGEGTISRLRERLPNGKERERWVARISWPDGRREVRYGRTHAEAARKLRAALTAQDLGALAPPPAETVEGLLRRWLDGTQRSIRASTAEKYERDLRVHVFPRVGRLPVARLTPDRVRRLYAELGEGGLSPMSIRHVHATLHVALRQCLREGRVARNVADLVSPPQAQRHPITPLSGAQVGRLLDLARGDPLEALFVLAVTTGMRRGELLGLQWTDVDLPGRALAVTGSLQRVTGLGQLRSDPKTAASRRRVPLVPRAVAALRRHRDAQTAGRERAGEWWQDHGLVFCTTLGTPLEAGNVLRRSFRPLLERAGLPPIRFHDLRHTAATLMLSEGVPVKVASEVLGHSTTAITADTYQHVTEAMQRQGVRAIDRAIEKAASRDRLVSRLASS